MRNSLAGRDRARRVAETSGASRSVITGCDADALPQSTWPDSGAAACFDDSSIFGRRPPPTPPRSAAAVRLSGGACRRRPCRRASRARRRPAAPPPWCCTASTCFAPKPPAGCRWPCHRRACRRGACRRPRRAVTCRGACRRGGDCRGVAAGRCSASTPAVSCAQFERLVRVVLHGRLGVVGHVDELQSTHLRQRSLGSATGADDLSCAASRARISDHPRS